jgi:hypothetical protein
MPLSMPKTPQIAVVMTAPQKNSGTIIGVINLRH